MNFTSRARAAGLLTAALSLVAVIAVNAQKDQRTGPLPDYFFSVEIAGQSLGQFQSVGGLKIETDVIEYRESGETIGPIRKLPGTTRFGNIRLTRAFTGDRALYNWAANANRVDGLLTISDRHGTLVAAFKFVNGFPVKWEGPELDASSNEMAIEKVEIAVESVTRADEEN